MGINKYFKIAVESVAASILAMVLCEVVIMIMKKAGLNIAADSLIGNVLLEVSILIAQFVVLMIHKESIKEFTGIIYNKTSISSLLKGFGLGFCIIFIMYIILFVLKIVTLKGLGFEYYDFGLVLLSIGSLFIRMIFAGTCEEIAFRGVLCSSLIRYKGKVLALVLSSLVFAVFHCSRYNDIIQLSSVLLTGLTLGYLYIRTKSLYMSIGLHIATDFFINFVKPKGEVGVFIFELNKYSMNNFEHIIFAMMALMYIMLLGYLLYYDKKHHRL